MSLAAAELSGEGVPAELLSLSEGKDSKQVAVVREMEESLLAMTEDREAALQAKAAAEQKAQPPQLGGPANARKLQVQVRELTRLQGDLERERSELARRAAYAEAQLAEIQQYLGTNIGKYQREILRLRHSLGQAGGR